MTLSPLSAYHEYLYDRGGQIVAQTVPVQNETLGRLITLDTALIGGGFIVAKGDVLPFWGGVAVLSLLVFSLGAALRGIIPTEGQIDRGTLGGLEAIPAFETRVIRRKKLCVQVASVALLAAFASGVAAVVMKGPPAAAPATIYHTP